MERGCTEAGRGALRVGRQPGARESLQQRGIARGAVQDRQVVAGSAFSCGRNDASSLTHSPRIRRMRFLPVALIAMAGALAAQQRDAGIPQLRRQGTATQLVVDGKPFLILGGELGNSTASDVG